MSVEIRIVDDYPKDRFQSLVEENLEKNSIFIRSWELYSPGEASFTKTAPTLKVAAFNGQNELIGLSWGQAETKNRFMMCMSLVVKEYRNQGIYNKMLDMILENTKQYDEVDSFHHIFNNQIIALKLKKDFKIVAMDNCAALGQRVQLRYFNNKKLLEIMKFRVGLIQQPNYKY